MRGERDAYGRDESYWWTVQCGRVLYSDRVYRVCRWSCLCLRGFVFDWLQIEGALNSKKSDELERERREREINRVGYGIESK